MTVIARCSQDRAPFAYRCRWSMRATTDPRAANFAPADVPLGPGMSVRIRVTVDRGFGLLTWDFQSIDPLGDDRGHHPKLARRDRNAVGTGDQQEGLDVSNGVHGRSLLLLPGIAA